MMPCATSSRWLAITVAVVTMDLASARADMLCKNRKDVVVDVVILPAGETIRFAKQPPQGGVGGNPRISIQFLDGSANPLGDPIFLGKCVQLN